MKWKGYLLGITALLMWAAVDGVVDVYEHPDLAQGLGITNYIVCLLCTLAGAWICMWAIGHVVTAKKIKIKKWEEK